MMALLDQFSNEIIGGVAVLFGAWALMWWGWYTTRHHHGRGGK